MRFAYACGFGENVKGFPKISVRSDDRRAVRFNRLVIILKTTVNKKKWRVGVDGEQNGCTAEKNQFIGYLRFSARSTGCFCIYRLYYIFCIYRFYFFSNQIGAIGLIKLKLFQ